MPQTAAARWFSYSNFWTKRANIRPAVLDEASQLFVHFSVCRFILWSETPFSTWLTPRQHLTGAAVTAAHCVRSLVILSRHQPDWAEVIWSRARCRPDGWPVASYRVIRRRCPDSAAGWFTIKASVAADSKGHGKRGGRVWPFLIPLLQVRGRSVQCSDGDQTRPAPCNGCIITSCHMGPTAAFIL